MSSCWFSLYLPQPLLHVGIAVGPPPIWSNPWTCQQFSELIKSRGRLGLLEGWWHWPGLPGRKRDCFWWDGAWHKLWIKKEKKILAFLTCILTSAFSGVRIGAKVLERKKRWLCSSYALPTKSLSKNPPTSQISSEARWVLEHKPKDARFSQLSRTNQPRMLPHALGFTTTTSLGCLTSKYMSPQTRPGHASGLHWAIHQLHSAAKCCFLFSSSLLGKLADWQVLVHTWVLHLLWPNKACHSQGPQLQKPSSVWKLLGNFLTEVLVISKPSQPQSCQVPLYTLELGWCYSYVVFCTSNSVRKLPCFCAAKSPTHGTPQPCLLPL